MATLTLLDVMVLIAVGGGALLGLMRGFVYEVLSLFAWVAVVIALRALYAPVTLFLGGFVSPGASAGLLAFAGIAGGVFFGGRAIATRIGRRTRGSVLGPVDRLLGLGFGALKGLIGVTLVFMAGNLVYDVAFGGDAQRPAWVREARAYPLLRASRWAIDDLVARRRGKSARDDPPPASTDGDAAPI